MGDWLRKGITVDRKCDQCDVIYPASIRKMERGWDLHCSNSCANKTKRAHLKRSTPYKRTRSDTKLKEAVRKRDHYQCVECGLKQGKRRLSVHRITPQILGGEYTMENCITVCEPCHRRIEISPEEVRKQLALKGELP